ncbi:hypothetical protein PV327_005895 [Microctonus hyperodae]|uniref:Odorant receptor n=1 Tax=Microctonus hyperodae TaxID=165561 RepID=A0AA39G356_MICHY|nr:hypothetical protein PV327_005895 [Microctonus hyperodae]
MLRLFSRYSTTSMTTSTQQSDMRYNSTKATLKKDLDWAIGWNRLALQIVGLWTEPKQSKLRIVFSHFHTAILALAVFFCYILPQTVALIKVWGTTGLIIDNITVNLPSMVAEFKLLVLWYKKKDVAGIFAMIEQDWLNEKSDRERDVMIKCAKISKIFMIGGLFGSIGCVTLYIAPITFNMVIRTINNITDIPGALFSVQTVYFYDVTSPAIYRLTVFSQFIGGTSVCLLYAGVDVIFGMFVMHLCGQLENLSYKLETMADREENFQKLLRINIERHCCLIRYRNKTENIFNELVLALVIFSDNTKMPITQIASYIMLIVYLLFLMFIYSWAGENLVTKSESLFTAVYNCNWTSLKPNEFRQITFILMRTEKALHLTAGKFTPVTLNTFVTIVKTSCGWVSVLLAMKN